MSTVWSPYICIHSAARGGFLAIANAGDEYEIFSEVCFTTESSSPGQETSGGGIEEEVRWFGIGCYWDEATASGVSLEVGYLVWRL